LKSLINHLLAFSLTVLLSAVVSAAGYAKPLNGSAKHFVMVILGDSLTAGYGIDKDKAFPDLLEKKLKKDGLDIKVINAGVSGSTSASGPSRLKWQLKALPSHLVLALGANDGLRGIKPEETEGNLKATIKLAKQNHLKVFLLGMKAPPNYGKEFTEIFEATFKKVAKEENVDLMPFLLESVAGERSLNQADGIHPNEKGHEIIAENIYRFLRGKIE